MPSPREELLAEIRRRRQIQHQTAQPDRATLKYLLALEALATDGEIGYSATFHRCAEALAILRGEEKL